MTEVSPRRGGRAARTIRRLGAALAVALLLLTAWSWWDSRLPASYSAEEMGTPDGGLGPGGQQVPHDHGGYVAPGTGAVPVTELVGQTGGPADVHVEMEARAVQVTPPGGQAFAGFTLGGTTPGPQVRARQGDLVEVVLHNVDVAGGVTLHWHGVDVPNAMDGVAGVTQDAVAPGASFTYRFVAEDAGSYWYHSHQISHHQVAAGLYGAFVVEPAQGPAIAAGEASDVAVLLHTYPSNSRAINGTVGEIRHEAAPGERVRVRVANTDNGNTAAWVAGGEFRVLAIDGTDVHGPTVLRDVKVPLTAGARADLEVVVPQAGAVRVQAPGVSLVVGPAGAEAPEVQSPAETFDPLGYGTPAELGFDPTTPDRSFTYDIGRRPGFLDGRPGYWWTVNGRIGQDAPMFMVSEGDVVAVRIGNRSGEGHPMHLHGHHMVVLARDGVPATGSPWWVDSLDVRHGETYDVAFVANNPGIWMDHCHNLPHAAEGLLSHVMYEGVSTPFRMGRETGNEPE